MRSSDPQSVTSLTLLQRACSNDQEAWSKIWELYIPLIYSQCRAAGVSAVDVEDIAQNVFISVPRRLSEFRKTDKNHTFRGWLYTITRNEIINFFRAQAKGNAAKGGSDNLKLIDQLPDEPFTDSNTNQPRMDPVLQRALEIIRREFDERTWGIYTRFKVDDMPAKKVAEEFGTTDGNVRLIAFRVKKRIDADFGELVKLPE